jgi:hypothetical protein
VRRGPSGSQAAGSAERVTVRPRLIDELDLTAQAGQCVQGPHRPTSQKKPNAKVAAPVLLGEPSRLFSITVSKQIPEHVRAGHRQ